MYNEPWEVKGNEQFITIRGQENALIADLAYSYRLSSDRINYANRIVACVNACKGMSDEEVGEIPNLFMNYSASIDDRKALQAQLAEAVELLKKIPTGWDNVDFWITEADVNQVRAFLKKQGV
jgi:hypothetical protein